MAGWGFSAEDLGLADGGDIEVWPVNRHALELFLYMTTQWRTDFGVRTGMDYGALERRIDHLQRRLGLDDDARDQLERDLREMESHALEEMSKQ